MTTQTCTFRTMNTLRHLDDIMPFLAGRRYVTADHNTPPSFNISIVILELGALREDGEREKGAEGSRMGDIQDLFLAAERRFVVSRQKSVIHAYPRFPFALPYPRLHVHGGKVFVTTLLKDCNEENVVGHGMERKRRWGRMAEVGNVLLPDVDTLLAGRRCVVFGQISSAYAVKTRVLIHGQPTQPRASILPQSLVTDSSHCL